MGVDLAGIGGSALTDAAYCHSRSARRRHSGHVCAGPQYSVAVAGFGLGGSCRRGRYFRGSERRRLLGLSRTAGRNSSKRSSAWRDWRPRPGSKARPSKSRRRSSPCPRRTSFAPAPNSAWTTHDRIVLSGAQPTGLRAENAIPAACAPPVLRPRTLPIPPATAECVGGELPPQFGYHARLIGTVAQLVEQGPFKALVLGSSPSRPTSTR